MPLLFSCPHCGTKTEVEDQYSGLAGECVACGKPIQLPRFATLDSADSIVGETQPAKVHRKQGWNLSPAKLAAGSVLFMLLIAFGYVVLRFGGTALRQIQSNQNRVVSINNLQSIARALDQYAEVHGTYPPPYTVDAQGKPLHSWRVLILPFLDEEECYAKLDLNLPWDSEVNQVLHYDVPRVYTHPNHSGPAAGSAYQLLVGNQGVFTRSKTLGPKDVIDGASKTILVVEVNPSDFARTWMEPSDIEMDRLMVDTSSFWAEMEGLDPEGVMVATVDGRVHVMRKQTQVMTVNALFTPRGGEPLADDVLDSVLGTQ